MKRSERLHAKARHAFWLSLVFFGVASCIAIWAISFWLYEPSLGAGMVIGALVLWCISVIEAANFGRYLAASKSEARYEWEREVRPRL